MAKSALQAYSEYQNIEYDYVDKLPVGWKLLPNIALFEERIDKGHSDEELLSVTIGKGVIKQSDNTIKKDSSNEDKSNYKLVKLGDIAYNKMRMWQGALGYCGYQGIVSPAYIILSTKSNVSSRYYHYLFRTSAYINYSKRQSYGIVDDQLSLRYKDFKRMYSVVPPIKTQNKIVEYLNQKTQQTEHFIQKQSHLIELLEEQKKAIINKAVTQGVEPDVEMKDSGIELLGKIPSHWEVKPTKYIFEERSNKSKNGIGTLLMMSQEYGLVPRADFHQKSEVANSTIGHKVTFKNDLVFNKLKAHLGVFFVNNNDDIGLVSPDYAVYIPKSNILVKYYEYLYRHPLYILIFQQKTTGIVDGFMRLYTSDLFKIKSIFPPEKEQHDIISYIAEKNTAINKAIQQAKSEIKLSKEYLDSLVYQVVTGQLEVKA